MEFSLNERGKNKGFHTGRWGSRYGSDKCFPKCPQDCSVQLLWKFQNSPKNPHACLKKSLSHISVAADGSWGQYLQGQASCGDLSRPGSGGLVALSFSILVRSQPSAELVSHPVHGGFYFLGPRHRGLGFQHRHTVSNSRICHLFIDASLPVGVCVLCPKATQGPSPFSFCPSAGLGLAAITHTSRSKGSRCLPLQATGLSSAWRARHRRAGCRLLAHGREEQGGSPSCDPAGDFHGDLQFCRNDSACLGLRF